MVDFLPLKFVGACLLPAGKYDRETDTKWTIRIAREINQRSTELQNKLGEGIDPPVYIRSLSSRCF